MRLFLLLIIFSVVFSSCRKEELPIPKRKNNGMLTNVAPLGTGYRYQLYYNLEKNEIIHQHYKTDWDLAFKTEANDFQILLNSANAMSVANFGSIAFDEKEDTLGFSSKEGLDAVSGKLDSTAIGDWRNKDDLFIVNRGYSYTGQHLGFFKIQILDVSNSKYTIKFGTLSAKTGKTLEIKKDDDYVFSYFSFETQQQEIIAPKKEEWDILFTQYTHIFYEPEPLPYLVSGVLLNFHETKAILYTDKAFEAVELVDVLNLNLSSDRNTIGYDWKTFSEGNYTIHSENTYIILDQKGLYYKLRFVDFYDENGQRGQPKWEYERL